MPFVKEDFAVKPKAWKEESGPCHYGWLLELKQKDLKVIEKTLDTKRGWNLLDASEGIASALSSVGMEVLEDAEEPQEAPKKP